MRPVKLPQVKDEGEGLTYAEFHPSSLSAVKDCFRQIELVEVNLTRRFEINNEVFKLVELSFESGNSAGKVTTLPSFMLNHNLQQTESETSNREDSIEDGSELIRTILELTVFYLLMLALLKGIFIYINVLKVGNYSLYINNVEALTDQIEYLLTLKSTLVMGALGHYNLSAPFVADTVAAAERVHFLALEQGWQASNSTFFSQQSQEQVSTLGVFSAILFQARKLIDSRVDLLRNPSAAAAYSDLLNLTTAVARDLWAQLDQALAPLAQ